MSSNGEPGALARCHCPGKPVQGQSGSQVAHSAMARILIVYSSTDGQTRKICHRVQQLIEARGDAVTLVAIDDALDSDPRGFDKVVIGARIRYGRHHAHVFEFVNRHAQALDAVPSAFFSVNIVARKPEKNRPQTNPYVQRFLQQVAWRPKLLDVFAGKLDYPRYRFFDRLIIRFIMLITGGPTDPRTVVEFTDWERVEAFARAVVAMDSASQPR
jgi:menaquinone-dependent protoporphyrinogen oxidase